MNLYTTFAMFELFNGMSILELSEVSIKFHEFLDNVQPDEAVKYIERIQAEFKGTI